MRRTAEKLSLWGDIKKWRNKIIKTPEVQRVFKETYSIIIYRDNLRARVLSIDIDRSGDLTYETDCHKFVMGLETSFVLNDTTIKIASVQFLSEFHNSIKSGEVCKRVLERV